MSSPPQKRRKVYRPILVLDSLEAYNQQIKRYLTYANYEDAWKVYYQIQRRGLKPNHLTYFMLISSHALEGDKYYALRAFKEMRENGIKPKIYIYTLLLDLCYQQEDGESAWAIFNDICENRVKLDLNMYNQLLELFVKMNDINKCKAVAFEMWWIAPNTTTYYILLKLGLLMCCKNLAWDTFDELCRRRARIEEPVYHRLFALFVLKKDTYKANSVLDKMIRNGINIRSSILNILS